MAARQWTKAKSSIILVRVGRLSAEAPPNRNVKDIGRGMNLREDGFSWRASTRSIG